MDELSKERRERGTALTASRDNGKRDREIQVEHLPPPRRSLGGS